MKLREIAHARTGDKGDITNIAVIAYRAEDWALLEAALTEEAVGDFLGAGAGKVRRYALPQLHALNFVIGDALTGGVTRSLALDAHGKCRGASLLDMQVQVDPTAR
ncbi:hypothetical protein SAMN04490244_107182 [Tranquillimonas rosea]|uniref:AtuA-like ferredoxin-fold domain-containing protein n=1 Tax=Tranquillimonas rosea TaxID=641238 RepID=A0A1H9VK30_9RHOB|nr:hypothetical protein [Tranquillimonas rosea]SES22100.1 hypothetical protein SAMN04490244_107182 [Tranquillimonas rosea]